MNKLILAFVVCFGLTACGNNDAKKNDTVKVEQTQSQEVNNRVEILYFHGKQRCATCMAIEKNAKEVIEAQFAEEIKNGTVVFKAITFPNRRMKRLPRNTRLHGLPCSSASG